MSHCFNPTCPQPVNEPTAQFCQSCGSSLVLGDRYRALQVLGQGGFGKTFLAVDITQNPPQTCVIKQFLPVQQGESVRRKASELFRQEAEQLKELGSHPQIPTLYAYLEVEDFQYLVQEFVRGQTLEQELKQEGPFSEIKILRLLNDLLPILQLLHDHQIIHRDIKPTNLIRPNLEDPTAPDVVLVDFGASKYATREAMARTGTLIGSAGYAAPEQVMGRAEFASDLYSMGVTCIHLMTGLHPFDLYSPADDAWNWEQYLPQPVDARLVQVLNKLLKRATNQRFRSAAAVLKALNARDRPVVRLSSRSTESMPSVGSELALMQREAVALNPDPSQASSVTPAGEWTCYRTLTGHEGPITAVAVSPDGLLIATGSTDRSVKLWHLETGHLLHTFTGKSLLSPTGHSDRISAVAFSPDGRTLISGSDDCRVIWWDIETRRRIFSRMGHEWVISALATSQNGQLLASGGGDGLVNLWDLESGEPIARLHKHRDRITSILLSPDGQTLISSSYDCTIRLWDLKSDRLISTLRGHSDRISSLAVSPNWLTLVSAGCDRTLRFWDLSQGKQAQSILAHRDAITCLTLAPQGHVLASGSEDNRIKLWNLRQDETGSTIFTGEKPKSLAYGWSVSAIAFGPDGRTLVSGSADETVRIWIQV
ncbi:protein kinase domain-containing protein [Leptolyngbya sp. AN02str]|uniref:protein kinase domain-containing protein n=1 Tax=Leptolyngbya sp. AN02str TaxID=3423363 RepID=UPI003D30F020